MLKAKNLYKLGIPPGEPTRLALAIIQMLTAKGYRSKEMEIIFTEIVSSPNRYVSHNVYGSLAKALWGKHYILRAEPAPYYQWGEDLDIQSVEQIANACQLPVAVAGALMPDAHVGYGLPIGGVLATDNAVIPYAVGVDIACRMKLTVLDIPLREFSDGRGQERLTRAIVKETRFGVGAFFKARRAHDVLDADWSVSPVTLQNKDKAWKQLGTSGSGNHFVEFGVLVTQDPTLGLPPGQYVALLSHSGSRGTGAAVAAYYSKLAQQQHPELPQALRHLAWLDMDTAAGQEYWAAMTLMGHYAAANHACIHRHIAEHLSAEVLLNIENHHNFAWQEQHLGKDVIVHRKGSTPASENALGVIPGSMASPAYVVRGKGNPASLHSAAHGAGRIMSRKKAKQRLNWEDVNHLLAKKNITLLSAGIDEAPFVYKDIDKVMALQSDLVEVVATFRPRLVKMAPAGERPED